MNTIDAIKNRRSIRAFKPDDISNEIVEDIINCGRLAPSVRNRQPWYFGIIKGKTKEKITEMMEKFFQNNDDTLESQKLGSANTINYTTKVIRQAPILILVFKEINNNWTIGDNLSIGACIENMCLRATELGLGTLWIRDTIYVEKEIINLLKTKNMELNSAIALGIPKQNPKPTPRKELKDIIKWYEDI